MVKVSKINAFEQWNEVSVRGEDIDPSVGVVEESVDAEDEDQDEHHSSSYLGCFTVGKVESCNLLFRHLEYFLQILQLFFKMFSSIIVHVGGAKHLFYHIYPVVTLLDDSLGVGDLESRSFIIESSFMFNAPGGEFPSLIFHLFLSLSCFVLR